ncbi:hypothetical protein RFI_08713 [Reticulomyxa filosa]|uniref:Phosphatidylinositol-specific phospholipase C X domain-containing protein n=1 Tax=Reticulomyxa filosa TaxID=46433 RepID=X6NRT9_RETFI|nr:hypothetical protein RFI_08713 [Reticulomyxa filosa]|eukprot:ETO28414.1 hypothetical protein RFI_08713 [Reticulomyxa filosa]
MKKIRKKSQKLLEFLKFASEEQEQDKKEKKQKKQQEKENDGQVPLKCWMKEFEDIPLSYLTLPGTHNAHAYKFKWVFSFLSNFTINQHWDIYRHLKGSLSITNNFLKKKKKKKLSDVQKVLCWQYPNGDIVCAHRFFVSVKFEKVMKHVGKYLNKYPSEIVILRVKCENGWKSNPPTVNQLIEIAKKYVGNRLAPFTSDANYSKALLDMKIKDLLARQWNVILFYEFEYNEYQMVTSWLHTQSELPKPLLYNIVEWIQGIPDNKKAFRNMYSRNQDEHSNAAIKSNTSSNSKSNDKNNVSIDLPKQLDKIQSDPFFSSSLKNEDSSTNESSLLLFHGKGEDEDCAAPLSNITHYP